MFALPIDAFRQHAAAVVTRRLALSVLGGAALTTRWTSPTEWNARAKRKPKPGKKFEKQCDLQKARCRAEFGEQDQELFPCCESCYTDDFLTCFIPFVED